MKKIERLHFIRLRSTSGWVKDNAERLLREAYTVVVTDEQTAGYGRQGRQWMNQAGKGLAMTVCYFTQEVKEGLALVAALAIVRALKRLGFEVGIKWPNDLQIRGKKLGGVLCEVMNVTDGLCISIGVGINVKMRRKDLEHVGQPATSLVLEQEVDIDIKTVSSLVQQELCMTLDRFQQEGLEPSIYEYQQHIVHQKGDLIHFHQGDKKVKGLFQHIDEEGTLHLQIDGKNQEFRSGEIIALSD